MLGLSNGLMYQGTPSGIDPLAPITIDDCIGWWDFTDSTTMWIDGRPSSGFPYYNLLPPANPVSSDDDEFDRIDNKAWTLQSNTSNALGKWLAGSNTFYKTGGANGYSYVKFSGLGARVYNFGYASGESGIGDSIDNEWDGDQTVDMSSYNGSHPLSQSTIDLADFTIFLVADAYHSDGRAFSIFGDKTDPTDDASRKEFHLYYDKTSTTAGQYKMDCYDGTTTTTINSGTTGKSDNLHIITGVLSGSGDSKLYRDGDNTDGTTSASSGSGSIDLTTGQGEDRILIGRNMNLGASSDSTAGVTSWSWHPNGRIYEIICYDRELTSEELSTIETHLKEKYGIS